MSFKSNVQAPDFQQMALQKLQLALQMRQQKQRDEAFREKSRLDKIAAINKAKSDAFDLEKKKFDFEKEKFEFSGQVDEAGEGIASARSLADKLPTPSSMNIQGSPEDTNAFRNIMQGLDPVGVTRGIGAEQAFFDRVNTAAKARSVVSRTSRQEAINSALGSADVFMSEKENEELQKSEDAIQAIRDKTTGKLESIRGLISTSRDTKVKARKARARGDANLASDLEWEARIVDGLLEQERRGVLGAEQPSIPLNPGDVKKLVDQYQDSGKHIQLALNYAQLIDSGAIRVGVGGKLTTASLYARGILESLTSIQPDGFEVGSEIVDAINNADPNSGKIDVGEQLSVGLVELALAYAFVRGERNSARFTILELERTLKEFRTTGVFNSPARAKAAARKVFMANARNEAFAKHFLMKAGYNVSDMDAAAITPERQRQSDLFNSTGMQSPRSVGVDNFGGADPIVSETPPKTSPPWGSKEHLDSILMGTDPYGDTLETPQGNGGLPQ